MPILGILIATRRPDNTIGWLYIIAGLVLGISSFLQLYAIHALLADSGWPGGRLAGWIGTVILPIPVCILPFLFLLFPTGHLASRRWRPVGWLSAGVMVAITLFSAVLATRIWDDPFRGFEAALSELAGIWVLVFAVVALSIPLALMLSFSSVVTRFRGSTVEERLQLKWFVTAAAFVVVTFSIGFFLESFATSVAASLGLVFLDVSVAIAILKYRLYDIDVIIGKTIVYGALAVFITIVYVLVVVVIGAFVGATEGLALVATAIVAVAFQGMRERAQRVANRLVYGSGRRRTRCSRSSPNTWARPTRARRSCRGWLGCSPRGPARRAPWSGSGSTRRCVRPPPGHPRTAGARRSGSKETGSPPSVTSTPRCRCVIRASCSAR